MEGSLPGVWVMLSILLLALGDDIRIFIKDDEASRPEFDVDDKALGGISRRTYVVPQSRLPTNLPSLRADIFVA